MPRFHEVTHGDRRAFVKTGGEAKDLGRKWSGAKVLNKNSGVVITPHNIPSGIDPLIGFLNKLIEQPRIRR